VGYRNDLQTSLKESRSSGMTRLDDFLLAFHSRPNCGSISHRFRDTMRYWLKIINFWYRPWSHLYLAPMLGVTSSEFHSLVSIRKTRMKGLLGDEKSLKVNLAVSIQQRDGHRQTDRQTDRRQQRRRYSSKKAYDRETWRH